MSPAVVVSAIGLALLMVLVPMAVHQRRLAAGGSRLAAPDPALNDGAVLSYTPTFSTGHTPSASAPFSVGQVAVGVFLGLWMFTITAGILAVGIMVAVTRSNGWR
ncbi:MAG TPA: hypothetical protein DCQ04_16540 [Actinobacteria bacterium]|nr:hypothetical protein [Actinomycetota bacterium]